MDEMKLDDELRRALNVDPSPEFLARVRTRIANEPEPSPWRLAWMMVPAAAVSAAVLVGILLWPRPEPATPVQAVAPPSPVSVLPPPVVAIVDRAPVVVEPRRVVARVAERRAFPEVVISEDETRAFDALLTLSQQGRLPVAVQADGEVETSLAPAPVEIQQLIIAPLQMTRLE